MSTYIDFSSRATTRIMAEALAGGPIPQSKLADLLSNDNVDMHFRQGYAILFIQHPDLFPDTQEMADKALTETTIKILYLDPADTQEIQRAVASYKDSCAPGILIFQEAGGFASCPDSESLEANKARITQALLAGRFPARLQAQLELA